MAGYESVDPFYEIAQWLASHGVPQPETFADEFMNDMFDRGVVVFGYTQIPELLEEFKELSQAVAYKTYEENILAGAV